VISYYLFFYLGFYRCWVCVARYFLVSVSNFIFLSLSLSLLHLVLNKLIYAIKFSYKSKLNVSCLFFELMIIFLYNNSIR